MNEWHKKLTTRLAIVFCVLLCCTTTKAQLHEEYIAGSIVLQGNEKIEGFIKNEAEADLCRRIYFKKTVNDKKTIKYDATNLQSFKLINGEQCKSITIKIAELKDSIKVLALLLVNGDVSLYKSFYRVKEIFIVERENQYYCLQDDDISEGYLNPKYFKQKLLNALPNDADLATNIANIPFSESSFTDIVSKYNMKQNATNEIITINNKPLSFISFDMGGMKNKNNREIYGRAELRTYFPKISRSTFFSIGCFYSNYVRKEYYTFTSSSGYTFNPTSNTIVFEDILKRNYLAIPITIQQNIFNKKIRPYISGSLSLLYADIKSENFKDDLDHQITHNIRFNPRLALGIEIDIYKGLQIRAEQSLEPYEHLLLVGIGYWHKVRLAK